MGASAQRIWQWWRRLVVLAVVAAVALPALRNRDSYPLSTYPVYATARGRVASLDTAVAVEENGRWSRLSLPVIAETDDPLIAEDRVGDLIADGLASQLCAEIARRARTEVNGVAVVAIEVVTERLDVVEVASGRHPPHERTVHARCPLRP
jgi:hypothetical protein